MLYIARIDISEGININPIKKKLTLFSPEISKFCYVKKYRYRLHFDI